MKEIICSGPLYKGMEIEKDRIRIHFDFAGDGLTAEQSSSTEFVIAGEDGVFFPAQAIIEGNSVVVYSDAVPHPVAVRFAWRNFPDADLYNSAGLPASPFRTDNW